MMLTEKQLEIAREKLGQLSRRLQVKLYPGPDPTDAFSKALCRVIDQIGAVADDALEVERVTEPAAHPDYPSLAVRNVTYLAVPLEQEFEPFLDLLTLLSKSPSPTEEADETEDVDEDVDEDEDETVIAPARLEILIALTCPNCPAVVAACSQLAASMPQIKLEIIDVQTFSELAGTCRSVPTVIIDGTRTIVGTMSFLELLQALQERSDPGYFLTTLSSMIEAGRLIEAVPLLTSEQGHEALATMLSQGSMQDRMGLMLVVENALKIDPHSLDAALPNLLPLLDSDDPTLRGDTADLLGQIGAPGARESLTRLLADDNPDVREVAQESLEMLRQPS